MQAQQLELLKKQIEHTSILTSDERTAWLASLPLMNDKQAAELQEILSQGVPEVSPAASLSPIPPIRPLVPSATERPEQKSAQQLPGSAAIPLSHITNLPLGVNFSPQTKTVEPPQAGPTRKPLQHRESGKLFASHLKEVLREKELPEGHPLYEHDLPPAHESAAQKKSPPQKSVPMTAPITAKAMPVASVPSSVFFNAPPPPMRLGKMAPPPPPRVPEESEEAIQPDVTKPIAEAKLESLQDVSNLSLNAFRSSSFPLLADRLEKLNKKFGYFDVLFALERSPLYQKYLEAGKTVLEQNISFVKFFQSKENRLEIRMTKEEFETMADLLRRIQVTTS